MQEKGEFEVKPFELLYEQSEKMETKIREKKNTSQDRLYQIDIISIFRKELKKIDNKSLLDLFPTLKKDYDGPGVRALVFTGFGHLIYLLADSEKHLGDRSIFLQKMPIILGIHEKGDKNTIQRNALTLTSKKLMYDAAAVFYGSLIMEPGKAYTRLEHPFSNLDKEFLRKVSGLIERERAEVNKEAAGTEHPNTKKVAKGWGWPFASKKKHEPVEIEEEEREEEFSFEDSAPSKSGSRKGK